jgi:hypothetical protein
MDVRSTELKLAHHALHSQDYRWAALRSVLVFVQIAKGRCIFAVIWCGGSKVVEMRQGLQSGLTSVRSSSDAGWDIRC